MGVGAGLYMCDVVVKSSRSLSHLLMSSCNYGARPGRDDIVLHGDPAPSPHKGHSSTPSQFLTHVHCGQTAGWMKTPLGTEVDIGAGHIVLDGLPALRERGTAPPPSFRPMSIVIVLWPRSPISATAELLLHNRTRTHQEMR